MNNEYNGWTNYATWRVQLDIVDDLVEAECADDIERARALTDDEWRDMIEGWVESHREHDNSLMMDYADAFLSDVNYYELSDAAVNKAKNY